MPLLNLILTPKACKALRITSPTLVKTVSSNLISSVLIASENKVKTSSACTASGSDLYCSNLLAKLLSLTTLLTSILSMYSFKELPKAICVSGLFLTVLNNNACKNSWDGAATAISLSATSLLITIVCLPVFGFWIIKPCCPEALESWPCSLKKASVSSVLANSWTSRSLMLSAAFLILSTSCVTALEPMPFRSWSISFILSDCSIVKLASPTCFICSLSCFFSLSNCTALASSLVFNLSVLKAFTVPWVCLKLILIASACSFVTSPDNTLLFSLLSNILYEFLFLDISTWASVVGWIGSKACWISLNSKSELLFKIELILVPVTASLTNSTLLLTFTGAP